jgi:hypothetical protein
MINKFYIKFEKLKDYLKRYFTDETNSKSII